MDDDLIRTRNANKKETIERTLDRAGVEYTVYREFAIEIETEEPEPVLPREGTMNHDILVELSEIYPTSITAKSLSERIDRSRFSTSAQCSKLHESGFLNREKMKVDNGGGNPFVYSIRGEFVECVLDTVVTADDTTETGLSETFG